MSNTIGRILASSSNRRRHDPTITEMTDPIVQAVMEADGIDPKHLVEELRGLQYEWAAWMPSAVEHYESLRKSARSAFGSDGPTRSSTLLCVLLHTGRACVSSDRPDEVSARRRLRRSARSTET